MSLAYEGIWRTTTSNGATATFTVWGTCGVIVGTMGPTWGSAEFYLDGRKIATVSTYSSTTKSRAVLAYVHFGRPARTRSWSRTLPRRAARASMSTG
jgi:hypothetical protein